MVPGPGCGIIIINPVLYFTTSAGACDNNQTFPLPLPPLSTLAPLLHFQDVILTLHHRLQTVYNFQNLGYNFVQKPSAPSTVNEILYLKLDCEK